nr:DNA cytosine methyltransferase [uncultured Massilia sp.]
MTLETVFDEQKTEDSSHSGEVSYVSPQKIEQANASDELISYRWHDGKGVRTVKLSDGRAIKSTVPSHRLTGNSYGAAEFEYDWLRSNERPASSVSERTIKVGDAFCGGGIFSLGVDEALRAAGITPIHAFGLDFNLDAINTFKLNFPDSVALHADITSVVNGAFGEPFTKEELEFVESVGGGVDLLVAGPPCQGHSDLNNHTRRQDPKNNLYFSVVRLAELLQPEFILVENVPGVIHDKGQVVQRTAEGLTELGYHVTSSLVELIGIGVPQKRKRFVLVASRKGELDIGSALAASTGETRPVSWAIDDLQNAYDEATIYNSSAVHSKENQRRINYLFDNDLHDLPNAERPPCHRDKPHSYVSVYGRMHWDRPAPTITGGFGSTGQGRFVHPLCRRTLTPHEAFRLQFGPDYFRFPATTGRRSMQQIIGNAAPPKLSQAIVLGAAIQGVLV